MSLAAYIEVKERPCREKIKLYCFLEKRDRNISKKDLQVRLHVNGRFRRSS
jgi:hypothetical protein